jgi:hypothetical protein
LDDKVEEINIQIIGGAEKEQEKVKFSTNKSLFDFKQFLMTKTENKTFYFEHHMNNDQKVSELLEKNKEINDSDVIKVFIKEYKFSLEILTEDDKKHTIEGLNSKTTIFEFEKKLGKIGNNQEYQIRF